MLHPLHFSGKNAYTAAAVIVSSLQGCKLFVARSRQPLHIAVNDLQRLLFRHDPLQGFVGRRKHCAAVSRKSRER